MAYRVTAPERCLIYLLERAGVQEHDRAAEQLTQDYIAEMNRMRRSHVSRAMTRLMKRGLVRTDRVHVRSSRTRKLAYFLTERGLREAKELRQRLEEVRVVVVDLEGNENERPLYEVPNMLPKRPRFYELLANMEEDLLDLRSFQDRQTRLRSGKVFDVREAIHTKNFCGREDEFAELDSFLDDKKYRVFQLVGLPGIGKTALASHWVEGVKGRIHVFWRRLRPEMTGREVMHELARFLHIVGFPALAEYMQRPQESGKDESLSLFSRDISNVRVLVVLDDAHTTRQDVGELVREMLKTEPGPVGPKVLVVSRERVSYIKAEDVVRGRVKERTLDDLSRKESERVLAGMGVHADRYHDIWEHCGGHPLSLELAAAGGMSLDTVRYSSSSWLEQEVLSRLETPAREALALVAIFGEPVELHLLGAHAKQLQRFCLLRQVEGGCVGVHDIVKDAVIGNLTPKRLAKLHVQAGGILMKSKNPEKTLLALRHLISGNLLDRAAALVLERGEEIIDAGLAGSLLPILDQLGLATAKIADGASVELIQGHALFALGRWADAARVYERCSTMEDPRMVAEALLGQGKSEVQRHSKLALSLLHTARDRLEALGALRLLAETEYWIGGVNEDAGRLDEAREAFEKGRAIAYDVGDRRWEGLCTYGIGRVESIRCNYTEAIEHQKEAISRLERGGYRLDVAKVNASLGGDLLEIGRFEDAEMHILQGVQDARTSGALGILSSSLYNLASLHKERGQVEKAIPLLEESLELFEQQEKYDEAARCAAWLAHNAWKHDDRKTGDRYEAQAMQHISRLIEPALRIEALNHLTRANLRTGNIEKAGKYLKQAITEAKAAKLIQMERALNMEFKELI